ncbi:hypothetical protein B5M09_004714 [Aphanomyces astaci]|uniref:UmuC domain-containing protein n=1 Tax=Aphanomyces astaci TaxID=112090 RepID=A0A3R7WE59_APHAT|nr:hypothetical protein B5M09_004714 [Aphanomyces astaci]
MLTLFDIDNYPDVTFTVKQTDMQDGEIAAANDESTRVILHLDLDCFYAQVEHERLGIPHSEPLAVQQWGSLLAVNYAARPFGVVRSTLSSHLIRCVDGCMFEQAKTSAMRARSPHVETLGDGSDVAPNRSKQKAILRRYRIASRQVFEIVARHAPIYEKASIDEVYMDVSQQCQERFKSNVSDGLGYGATHVFGMADAPGAFPTTYQEKLLCIGAEIAQEIRDDIRRTLNFTTSVGIATNKLLSKLVEGKATPQQGATNAETGPPARVTAGAIVDELGLQGLQKHFGDDTGRYIYTLCMGEDGQDPVNVKKVLLAQLNSVKSFDPNKGGLVTTESLFQYWLRILCDEMAWRFEEERDENHRLPTQFTLTCERYDSGQKKLVRHFAVPNTVDASVFYAAAIGQIHDISAAVLPCSHMVLSAKEFVSTLHMSVKITHFFKESTVKQPSIDENNSMAPQDDGVTTTTDGRIDRSMPTKPSLSAAWKPPRPKAAAAPSTIAHFFVKGPTAAGVDRQGDDVRGYSNDKDASEEMHYCHKCHMYIATTAAEHADHHVALALSSKWNDDDNKARPTKQQKKTKTGPMDFFFSKSHDQQPQG